MNGTVVKGRNSLPFWKITGFVEYISSGHKQGDMLLVVPEGAHAARLGNEAKISQRIKVRKGSYYSLTFSAARTCAQMETLNVSVPPDAGDVPMQTLYSSSGWDAYAWAFQAAYDDVDVILHNPGTEEDPAYNLVRNGDFEEGPYMFENSSSGVLLPPNTEDDHSPLPGWSIESLKAVKYIDSAHYAVPQGNRAVELVAGRESAIAQTVRTVAGRGYVVSFSVGDGRNACNGSMEVEAFAGREKVSVPFQSNATGGFIRATLPFTATSAITRIAFFSSYYSMRSDDLSSLCGPVVDNVKLVALPANSATFSNYPTFLILILLLFPPIVLV
eukprot:Gb_14930 [translate_table: standard]